MKKAHAEDNPEADRLQRIWALIARENRKLLALDYDGTLAPFREDRMEARPLEGIVGLLAGISLRRDTAVAVVSGRPLKDLEELLSPWKGRMVGSHGWEERLENGEEVTWAPDDVQRAGLEEACRTVASGGIEGHLETKKASIALHTRALAREKARLAEETVSPAWQEIARLHGLQLMPFNGGLEIRARGRDKGSALAGLIMREPAGTFCVYVGDDTTDEDAFRMVRPSGIGIKVGDPAAQTAAQAFLPDVPAVRDFLAAWFRLAPGGRQRDGP